MMIRHERLRIGQREEVVVVLEGSKEEAINLLGAVSFGAPVLLRLATSSALPVARGQASRGLATQAKHSTEQLLSIIRSQPGQYRAQLEAFVQRNPTGGPSEFFREHFGTAVSAHGSTRLLFNSLYVRMRTIRGRLGLPRQIHHAKSSGRVRRESEKGEGLEVGSTHRKIPTPSEVRQFVEQLARDGKTVSTRVLQEQFYGGGFSPSASPGSRHMNKRLVDYGFFARRSVAKRLGGTWSREAASGTSAAIWRFVPDQQMKGARQPQTST